MIELDVTDAEPSISVRLADGNGVLIRSPAPREVRRVRPNRQKQLEADVAPAESIAPL